MNTDNNTCVNPLEEQRKEALKHYEEVSSAAHHWSSFIVNAIKAYNPPVSEPVKERKQIEVTNITQWNMTDILNGGRYLKVDISDYPKHWEDKIPELKKIISSVLNNDTVVEDRQFIPFNKIMVDKDEWDKRKYSQAEVDAIRADTWKAARDITDKVLGEIDYKDGDVGQFYQKKYNSYNDYLSSLNSNDKGSKWDKLNKEFDAALEKAFPEQPTNDNAFVEEDQLTSFVNTFPDVKWENDFFVRFKWGITPVAGKIEILPYTKRLQILPYRNTDDIGSGEGQSVIINFPRKQSKQSTPVDNETKSANFRREHLSTSNLAEPLPTKQDIPEIKTMSNIDAYQLGLKDGIKFQKQNNGK